MHRIDGQGVDDTTPARLHHAYPGAPNNASGSTNGPNMSHPEKGTRRKSRGHTPDRRFTLGLVLRLLTATSNSRCISHTQLALLRR